MIERADVADVAVLRIAHGRVGAMDVELCEAVAEQFHRLVTGSARAVVLTGTGSAFSAGVDLRRFLDGGADYAQRLLSALADCFRAVFELTKPVVAAVSGHAIEGGCVLACAADVTLMAHGPGRIGLPELTVGVPFPRVALEIVRYAVGEVACRRLIFGARTYPPGEAQGLGLVDQVVEPDSLVPSAIEAARGLAADIPSDTFAATKIQLRREAGERAARYADDDDTGLLLWSRRATDGWVARYLESATRQ